MNIYAIIILVTILGKFLLDAYTRWLNLRSMSPQVPSQFADLYDHKEYARSQEYTRVNTKFHLIESSIELTVLLIFWFAGGFNWLDQTARSLGYGPILTGIIFLFALGLAGSILSLPFDVYGTFVIEEKFGFNRTTLRTFILDRLKGLVLAFVLGIPLFAAILWFFHATGDRAWLYCWGFVSVYQLIVQFIAPVWLMPMFNKFTPLQDLNLKQAIADYAASVGFSFKDVFVVDASKRSTKANAVFTGFGRNKRIALFDTLLQEQSDNEVLAVLAHEIGHYQKRHVPMMLLINILHSGFVFYLLSLFISTPGLFDAFYMKERSIYAGFIFFFMLYGPVSFLLSIGMNVLSRHNEYQADEFAVKSLGEAENLISSLQKLSLKNLSNLTPHPLYAFLNYSHPPLPERNRAELEQKLKYNAADRLHHLDDYEEKIEKYLDSLYGECHLRDPRIAKLVADELRKRDGD